MKKPRGNASLAISLAGLAVGMLMLAYASVPLYRMFCEITGYGGTPKQAKAAPGRVGDRVITVRFNADTDAALAWDFSPDQKDMKVRVGEQSLASYSAHNRTRKPVTGHAVYNVLPDKAGAYFAKIECFCFQNQTLAAGQRVHMPISFFIDPAILDDPNMRDVKTITLSYTFFPATSESSDQPSKE